MARNLIRNLQRRQARQAADEAAKQLVLERWEQFCTKADIAILYTLWNDFGFGKARLKRFEELDKESVRYDKPFPLRRR